MSQPDAERTMHIGERDYVGFDFRAADLPTGVTVFSGSVTVSPSSGLTLDSGTAIVTDAADGVYAWLTVMAAGEYDVTFTVIFSDSKDLSRIYRVSVPQPSVTSKALVALDVLKAQLGIKSEETQWDDALDLIVESVSESFSRYIDYPLAKTTFTNIYVDGNGERDLYLPWKFISALTIEVDGTALTEGIDGDYVLYADQGMIRRVEGRWCERIPILVSSVTAGYIVQDGVPAAGETALPADLKYACVAQCQVEWKHSQHTDRGVTSRTMPDGTISKISAGLDVSVKEILDRYRRWAV